MGTVLIEKGTPTSVDAVTMEKITVLTAKGEKDSIRTEVNISQTVPLPLAKGQEIGKVTLYEGEEKIAEYPLAAAAQVEKASLRELISRLIHKTAGRS